MASVKLIRQVADYCWSNKFIGNNTELHYVDKFDVLLFDFLLDIFRNYFRDHGALFVGAPEICSGEHNMEYYTLFQDYLKLYEVCMFI